MNIDRNFFQKRIRGTTLAFSNNLREIIKICLLYITILALVNPISACSIIDTYNPARNDSVSKPETGTPKLPVSSSNTLTSPTEEPAATTIQGNGLNADGLYRLWIPTVENQKGSYVYVSTAGSDSNPGTFDQPFKTIQKGVDRLVPGSTLYIRGGRYTEKILITISGTSSLPITITAYPGETVIMDGSGLDKNLPIYTPLIDLSASYYIIENLELTYPKGRGIFLRRETDQDASHNIIRNIYTHHTWGQGIQVWGSDNLIENNKIMKADLSNDCDNRNPDTSINCSGYSWTGALTYGDSSHPYYGLNSTILNNEVYQGYGEGILGMYTDNAVIAGNRVWDNWAENIYLDDCSYSTIKNNLSFYTSDHEYWRYPSKPADGIELSNEGIIASHPIGHDRKIFNNIIINAGEGIQFWTGFASGSALINDVIANNTVVLIGTDGNGIDIGLPKDADHQNTIVMNNLVFADLVGDLGYNKPGTGVSFSHNLWSRAPDASVVGTGDVVGNPLLSNLTHTIDLDQIAHPVDPHWYELTYSSPAIGRASPLYYVNDDFFGNVRDSNPDMGADEY